jgi:DNA-binding NtrC family response regulator
MIKPRHPQLGTGYAWLGNFRDLEQCVRSYLIARPISRSSRPRPPIPLTDACATLAGAVLNQVLPYAEIERRVFGLIHARTGSYQEAARLLKLDWRTLRARTASTGRASVDGA